MDDRSLINTLRRYPASFGLDGSFREISIFLDGANVASDGSVLEGFQEWLTVEAGEGHNLAWQGLVLKLAFPDRGASAVQLRQLAEGEDQLAVRMLFDLLDRYWTVREGPHGMLQLYDCYLKWLRKQEWYMPGNPRYLD
jgi:hypothetical protein